MNPKRVGVIAVLLVAALGLAACQTPYHDQNERYVFVASNVNLPYWQEAQAGLMDAAQQMGVKAELTGPEKFDPQERLRGVSDTLKKYPAIKIVYTIDDKGDPRIANDMVSALLKGKAKIDGMICLEASGGSGAAEALHRLDAKVPIVGFDKDPETLDWIDRDGITA